MRNVTAPLSPSPPRSLSPREAGTVRPVSPVSSVGPLPGTDMGAVLGLQEQEDVQGGVEGRLLLGPALAISPT